jgi:hypothetical protein
MGNQLAGRPAKTPPMWDYCPACIGITKHWYRKDKRTWRCSEITHSVRARAVTMLKYKTLANPLHPGYTEVTESD